MHPIFIRFGPLAIHTYGVFMAIGFAVGLAVAGRRARTEGISAEHISDLGVWLIIVGMLGGKLFHIVFFWDDFIGGWREVAMNPHWHELSIWKQMLARLGTLREGFVFYGGFIFATLTAVIYTQLKKLPLGKIVDIFAPSIALGHAFGRLGCFFNGCCYGRVCPDGFPLGVRFPAILDATGRAIGSAPFIDHLQHKWVTISESTSLPVHPTQLYEVLGNLAIFAGLSFFYRHKRFDGQVWWLYVLSYGVLRLGVEFFRGDYDVFYFGVLTIGQIVAITMIVIASLALTLTPKVVKLRPA